MTSRRARVGLSMVAVVAAAQLVAVPHAAMARPPAPPPRGVAFVSDADGNEEIYVAEPDGSGMRRLTRTPWHEAAPAWSPDGQTLAYFVSRGDPVTGPSEIWTMGADGSNPTLLRAGLGASDDIAWAPDGRTLAFSFEHEEVHDGFPVTCAELWVMGADGAGARSLMTSQPLVTGLDWSPEGDRIVYGVEQHMSCEGRQGLWTMRPDGSDQRSLGAEWGRAPSWSPDGTTVAFDDWRNTCHACGEIWVMRADGDDQRALVVDPASQNYGPSWSPDGSRLAFERQAEGRRGVWVMNADGSGQTRLVDNGWDPDW